MGAVQDPSYAGTPFIEHARARVPPTQEEFLDFEIEVGPAGDGTYPIAVVRSVAGEARELMRLPFDSTALEGQLRSIQVAIVRSADQSRHMRLPGEQRAEDFESIQDFGRSLFDALFTGEVGRRYAVSQEKAAQQGKGLRLKLRILAPEIAALPWEFLFDPGRGEYVCLSRNTPLVRYIEAPQPPEPLPVTLPLRILGMIAAPNDLPSLDVERERQRIETAIEPLRQLGLAQLTWLSGQTWHDVQQAMRSGPWHIFHFIGHGTFDPATEEGAIAFADEDGHADMLGAVQLARLLCDHRSLRLVVLNACEGARGGQHDVLSSSAATLVRHGIPAVVAMQYAITDAAAIAFARALYEAICDGVPVDAAVSEARKAVSFGVEHTLEWGTPVLFMRSPNGALFTIEAEVAASPKRPAPSPHVPPSEPTVAPRARHWKLKPWLWALIAAGVLLMLGIVGAVVWLGQGGRTSITNPDTTSSVPPGFRLYSDTASHLQLAIPQDWTTSGSPSVLPGLTVTSADQNAALGVGMIEGLTDAAGKAAMADGAIVGAASSGTITDKVGPTNVSLAGETWVQESATVTRVNMTAHVVVLVTSHGDSTYVITYFASPPSAFATIDARYFQPAVQSFTFLSVPSQPRGTPTVPPGFRLYSDSASHLQLAIPQDWTATGSASSGGLVVASADKKTLLGVSEDRFPSDEAGKVAMADDTIASIAGSGGSITNKAEPTNVSLAGEMWVRESADVTTNGVSLHMVVLVTTHGGSTYTITIAAKPPSAFATVDARYFQPAVQSFTFVK